jgi:hypothetical protein
MQTEIVLYLNNELLEKAQRWAKSQHLSFNDAIASLLEQLPDPEQHPILSPWTQSLVGVLKLEEENLHEDTLHEKYLDYLEEKYQ